MRAGRRCRRAVACPARPGAGRCGHRRARPTARCTARWCARKPRPATSSLNPVIRLHYVEVQEPDMQDPSGDLRRLFNALEFEWRLTGLPCDLHAAAAPAEGAARAALEGHGGGARRLADHRHLAGLSENGAFGIAVDVGSTTIAAHLCDLLSGEVVASAGLMNPQIRFGEDLMSRVSYVMMNPGGAKQMTAPCAGAQRACGRCGAVGGDHAAGHSRGDSGRQSDHAPPGAGHRSDRARRRAVRAGDRSGR